MVTSDSPYQKPEDLAGKILAGPIGTVEEIQGKLLVSKGIGGEVKAFNDNAGCFLALQSGQVDAVMAMGFVAHHLIQFSREALRGDQNASFYSTRGRNHALASEPERQELPPLRRSA